MPVSDVEFALADAAATDALGAALAHTFPGAAAGAVAVHLHGDLGAGKTSCVRSLLRALGVRSTVRSPTYTLLETYATSGLTCIHVDLYRVGSQLEVEDLGLRDLWGRDHLFLIEWPEQGAGAVPAADLVLSLAYAGEGRRARVHAASPRGAVWAQDLVHDARILPYLSNLT